MRASGGNANGKGSGSTGRGRGGGSGSMSDFSGPGELRFITLALRRNLGYTLISVFTSVSNAPIAGGCCGR